MRISDWSSDVCSSDLTVAAVRRQLDLDGRIVEPHDGGKRRTDRRLGGQIDNPGMLRSEEHTSELQSLMRISYAVFCLKKKKPHAYTRENQYNTHKLL